MQNLKTEKSERKTKQHITFMETEIIQLERAVYISTMNYNDRSTFKKALKPVLW